MLVLNCLVECGVTDSKYLMSNCYVLNVYRVKKSRNDIDCCTML